MSIIYSLNNLVKKPENMYKHERKNDDGICKLRTHVRLSYTDSSLFFTFLNIPLLYTPKED